MILERDLNYDWIVRLDKGCTVGVYANLIVCLTRAYSPCWGTGAKLGPIYSHCNQATADYHYCTIDKASTYHGDYWRLRRLEATSQAYHKDQIQKLYTPSIYLSWQSRQSSQVNDMTRLDGYEPDRKNT